MGVGCSWLDAVLTIPGAAGLRNSFGWTFRISLMITPFLGFASHSGAYSSASRCNGLILAFSFPTMSTERRCNITRGCPIVCSSWNGTTSSVTGGVLSNSSSCSVSGVWITSIFSSVRSVRASSIPAILNTGGVGGTSSPSPFSGASSTYNLKLGYSRAHILRITQKRNRSHVQNTPHLTHSHTDS